MLETVFIKADDWKPPEVWYWWLLSGDNLQAPLYNNGEPYLPGVKTQWVRNLMWWFRNPIGNFVGRVVGVAGKDRWVTGPAPVKLVTWADAVPPQTGWKWATTRTKQGSIFGLPFISYYGICEFYVGWRPHDGALGFKLVNASRGEN